MQEIIETVQNILINKPLPLFFLNSSERSPAVRVAVPLRPKKDVERQGN